jgi:hypothetical protein
MLLAKQFRELILALLGIAVATGIVRAQPQGNKIWTVEARRRPSGSGVRRPISKVSRTTIVAPGGRLMLGR